MRLSDLQKCIEQLLNKGIDCEVYLPHVDMRKRLEEDRSVPPMSVKVYEPTDGSQFAIISANDLLKHHKLIYEPTLVSKPGTMLVKGETDENAEV